MNNFKFKKEDLILYILQKVEPGRVDLYRLNKLAFFAEFGYMFKTQNILSDLNFAGIDKGPVIDGYKAIVADMEKRGLIKSDGYKIRPLADPSMPIPETVSNIIDPILTKYSALSSPELIALSHETDSYKITTHNEAVMGKTIDKGLASLETFFNDELTEEEGVDLPQFKKEDLVPYETWQEL